MQIPNIQQSATNIQFAPPSLKLAIGRWQHFHNGNIHFDTSVGCCGVVVFMFSFIVMVTVPSGAESNVSAVTAKLSKKFSNTYDATFLRLTDFIAVTRSRNLEEKSCKAFQETPC